MAIQAPAEEHTEDSFFPIVGIQTSAEGPAAYTELLSHLSDEPGIAFVLVQHTDPKREAALAPLPPRRLVRFFTKSERWHQIVKTIRDVTANRTRVPAKPWRSSRKTGATPGRV